MLSIDDPVFWMNNTDEKVLDLWIAWLVCKADRDGNGMKPADEVFGAMAKQWQT